MIHAYLYVTRDKDWTGHGPSFLNLSQYVLSLNCGHVLAKANVTTDH
jgi:hypothetical protein